MKQAEVNMLYHFFPDFDCSSLCGLRLSSFRPFLSH